MESDDLLWGIEAIAKAINRSRPQAEHLRRMGILPIRKHGNQLVASRRALHAALVGPEAPIQEPAHAA